MKKIIFLALVALLGIHTVDAQRRGGTRTPEQIVEKLDKSKHSVNHVANFVN